MLFKKAKKSSVLQLAGMFVIAAFAMSFLACPGPFPGEEEILPITDPKDPQAEHYTVVVGDRVLSEDLVIVYDATKKNVIVIPGPDASPGKATANVLYVPADDQPVPGQPVEQVGTYQITIDVEEADGWNPAYGLEYDGTIIINDGNPTALLFDFDEASFTQVFGKVSAPKITPKEGGPTGDITIRYWAKAEGTDDDWAVSTTLPTEVGEYKVDFRVEAASPFNAATGLEAPYRFVIRANVPEADDFEFDCFTQTYTGGVLEVSITHDVIPSEKITIFYSAQPVDAGTYTVTFDVAEGNGFNAVSGLEAPIFTIRKADLKAADFEVEGAVDGVVTRTYSGSAQEVLVSAVTQGVGTITATYYSELGAPTNAGIGYAIAIDVADADNYNGKSKLAVGTLNIDKALLVRDDFTVTSAWSYTEGEVPEFPVTVTHPVLPASAITILYDGETEVPQAVGSYPVTFNAEMTNYVGLTNQSAGTLTIAAKVSGRPEVNRDDAKLYSLKINGAEAKFPANHPNIGIDGLTRWNTTDYTTITMTQEEFNKNDGKLQIEVLANDGYARILGFAVITSSSALYSNQTILTGTPPWDAYASYADGGLQGVFISDKTWVNNSNQGQGTRIFVWVQSANGDNGFYRVNFIDLVP